MEIPQRGGRKARTANVLLRSATLDFLVPGGGASVAAESLRVNVILAEEVGSPALSEPLHWVLLTTEAVNDAQAALQVVRYYELRWRIEDYHKVWKSGIGVERQRFQSIENLERMLVISAFLAVRLLQLREYLDKPANKPETSCAAVLAEDEYPKGINGKSCGFRPNVISPYPKQRRLHNGRFMRQQNWAGLPIPSAQGVLAGTRFGMVGFGYKNGFKATNSASWNSLSCD